MEYCHQAGIPHSEYLSWSDHDQEATIEYMLHSKARCPGCGTFPDEWLAEDGRPHPIDPYIATTVNCLGCETIAAAREEIPQDKQAHVYVYLQVNEDYRGSGRFGRRTRQDRR